MTQERFETIVNGFHRMNPFRVYTIELNGGRRLEVDHPMMLALNAGVAVYVTPGGVPIIFESDSVNHIYGDLASMNSPQ